MSRHPGTWALFWRGTGSVKQICQILCDYSITSNDPKASDEWYLPTPFGWQRSTHSVKKDEENQEKHRQKTLSARSPRSLQVFDGVIERLCNIQFLWGECYWTTPSSSATWCSGKTKNPTRPLFLATSGVGHGKGYFSTMMTSSSPVALLKGHNVNLLHNSKVQKVQAGLLWDLCKKNSVCQHMGSLGP